MNYTITKIEDQKLISYNWESIPPEEEIIVLPRKELEETLLQVKEYLEKAAKNSEKITRGHVKYKKQALSRVGDDLNQAYSLVDSVDKFNLQSSIVQYQGPVVTSRKRKRLPQNKDEQALFEFMK
ncbi:MAG: hypothetical protein KKF16_05420 [Euryarchaeota archaeon]|nr:hypothetical protein [Euryarchaeota archaeon]MBU4608278.1 hypothetical protein [Euryarchaeota archaeon]MBV1730520.1 hypothetical protein [Methanobacterium sp.]MBV1755600.1 hypothetical protein [Methanobacterium sp.]